MLNREKLIKALTKVVEKEDNLDNVYGIARELRKLGYDFSVNGGATKNCLINNKDNYVVKWVRNIDECYDDEAMQEVDIYNEAVRMGIEKLFPKTVYLCSIKGVNIVVQERIDYSACNIGCSEIRDKYVKISCTVSNKIVEKFRNEMIKGQEQNRRKPNLLWSKMIISVYGKAIAKQLCLFVKENGINDLHDDNVGYKNMKPIILDFSGYHRD